MIVEVGKAYKLQNGLDCFCYIKDEENFYIVAQLPNEPRYNTFACDEQGVIIKDRDKEVFGERLLPFTADSIEVL